MTRIPYGYKIEDGRVVIDEPAKRQLLYFFRRFLEGESMAAAAKEARLPFSSSTYRRLLKRREYIGTEHYPAIITKSYQKELISEWEKRNGSSPRQSRRPPKTVPIHTDFRMTPSPECETSPSAYISTLYNCIRPKFASVSK